MMSSSVSIPSSLELPEGRLLVAFSGGEDSLSLLILLSFLAPDRTGALYVDHNLRSREELAREIENNRHNAASLSIPFAVHTLPAGLVERTAREKGCGTEAAARFLRYNALEAYRERKGYDYILTAHHQSDQVETLLMRILDGSPFWTWGGIRRTEGRIVRPLLDVGKEEIHEIVRSSSLVASEDSTNFLDAYRRNDVRHRLSPHFCEEEKSSLCHIAANVASHRDSLPPLPFVSGYWCSFQRNSFLEALPPQKEELLFSVLKSLGGAARVRRSFLAEVLRKTEDGQGRLETDSLVFYFSPEKVKVYRKEKDFLAPYLGPDTLLPPGLKVREASSSSLTLRLSEACLEGAVLRRPREGERILLKEGKRRIADLEKALRIPSSIVLEKDGEILAFFSSYLGGRDRLAAPLLGKEGKPVEILSL